MKHCILFTSLLLALVQACPRQAPRDPEYDAQSIAVANRRKRSSIQAEAGRFAITNVYVFDGFQYSNETTTVVIDNGIISDNTTDPVEIDGQGGTLMPGLFDSHNHPTELEHLQNLTDYGITTTMGAACWTSDLCASLRNQTGLTDMYSAGRSAVVPNSSHAQLANASLDQTIMNVSMCTGWVQAQYKSGASDYIKLVAESGGPTMSQVEHNTIIGAAHELGLRTWTHASTFAAYLTAIQSRTDFIQHSVPDARLNASVVSTISAQYQVVTPTLGIYQDPEKSFGVNASVAQIFLANIAANAKALYDAGVPILAGTDASHNGGAPAIIPFGSSLHTELELLSEAGIPNLEVLKAATSRPAHVFNLPDRGAISVGLRADLLLISGNPIANISKTREIQRVWVAGVEHQRSAT